MVQVFVHANGALAPTSVLKLSSKSTWREFIAAAAERLGFGDNYLLNVARPAARIFLSADGAEVKCLDDLEDGDTLSVSLDGSSWRPVPRQLKGLHAAAGLPASSKLPSGWSPRCNAQVFTAPPKSPQGPASAASPSTASSSARNMPADPMAHPIADPIADTIAATRAANDEAKNMLASYERRLAEASEEVRGMLEEARRDAEATKQAIVAEARKAADDEQARAKREIGLATDDALSRIAERAGELAVDVAGKFIRQKLSADDQQQLVRDSVAAIRSAPSAN
jgi:F-type H+-transporting ATPase subunit b